MTSSGIKILAWVIPASLFLQNSGFFVWKFIPPWLRTPRIQLSFVCDVFTWFMFQHQSCVSDFSFYKDKFPSREEQEGHVPFSERGLRYPTVLAVRALCFSLCRTPCAAIFGGAFSSRQTAAGGSKGHRLLLHKRRLPYRYKNAYNGGGVFQFYWMIHHIDYDNKRWC